MVETWRMWDEHDEIKLPDIRLHDPADDPAITIEARFTFDGTHEYQEMLMDGKLTGVRVLPGRCICGADLSGEAPDCRPDCPQHGADVPYDPAVSDIGEDPF